MVGLEHDWLWLSYKGAHHLQIPGCCDGSDLVFCWLRPSAACWLVAQARVERQRHQLEPRQPGFHYGPDDVDAEVDFLGGNLAGREQQEARGALLIEQLFDLLAALMNAGRGFCFIYTVMCHLIPHGLPCEECGLTSRAACHVPFLWLMQRKACCEIRRCTRGTVAQGVALACSAVACLTSVHVIDAPNVDDYADVAEWLWCDPATCRLSSVCPVQPMPLP